MQDRFNSNVRWVVVGMLLMVLSLTSVGLVQAAVNLTQAEKDWLTYMREEEKLARDVYIYLSGMYNLPIFNKIALSEQTHMDAIKTLLDRYGLPDPADQSEGKFTNPELQALYNKLIDDGSKSLVAALEVGEVIEIKDMKDLTDAIAVTERKDIKTVYGNLLQASLNHLQSFLSLQKIYQTTP